MNQKREHIAHIEARYGMSVRIEGDPALISPDFTLEKFKTATRAVKEVEPTVISASAALMDDIDGEDTDVLVSEVITDDTAQSDAVEEAGEDKPKKRRRRRRRRGKGNGADSAADIAVEGDEGNADMGGSDGAVVVLDEAAELSDSEGAEAGVAVVEEEKPKKKTVTRSRKKKDDSTSSGDDSVAAVPAEAEAEEKPKKVTRKPSTRVKKAKVDETTEAVDAVEEPKPKARRSRARKKPVEAEASNAEVTDTSEIVAEVPLTVKVADPVEQAETVSEPAPAQQEDKAPKPKKKGWWSLGG